MTVEEIGKLATSVSRRDIDPLDAVAWLNDGQDELGDQALVYDTDTILSSSDTAWEDLPLDLTAPVRVEDAEGYNLADYEVMGRKIRLPAGQYTLHYRRRAAHVTALTDTPEVDPLYHTALAYYLAWRACCRVSPSDADALRFRSEWKEAAARAYQTVGATGQPRRLGAVIRSVGQSAQRWRGEL